jgi:hypothetical protein
MKARKLIEDLINTREFQKFCDNFCPHRREGCRHDCQFFWFRDWVTVNG